MSNDLIKHEGVQTPSLECSLMELENMQAMTEKLLKMKHYQKMGDVGIFAILQKSKSIGLNPLDALNGGMYFVNGKVELSANTMNYLIRQRGHSIIKDERSTKEVCILKGKRADNGDTFTCSFSIDDAKKAGIYKNVWQTYPEDMLFARALTRLARQLFPDVCKGCYVEGELPKDVKEAEYEEVKESPKVEFIAPVEYCDEEQIEELKALISECDPEEKKDLQSKLDAFMIGGKLKKKSYEPIKDKLLGMRNEYQDKLINSIPVQKDEVNHEEN